GYLMPSGCHLPSLPTLPFFFLLRLPPRSPLFPYTTLFRSSRPCTSSKEVAQVGSISANLDSEVGKIIADAMEKVGKEGVITDFLDRKSTRLNSSHSQISYAVFCLKKKKTVGSHLGHDTWQR